VELGRKSLIAPGLKAFYLEGLKRRAFYSILVSGVCRLTTLLVAGDIDPPAAGWRPSCTRNASKAMQRAVHGPHQPSLFTPAEIHSLGSPFSVVGILYLHIQSRIPCEIFSFPSLTTPDFQHHAPYVLRIRICDSLFWTRDP
jgi:hypothetical protein